LCKGKIHHKTGNEAGKKDGSHHDLQVDKVMPEGTKRWRFLPGKTTGNRTGRLPLIQRDRTFIMPYSVRRRGHIPAAEVMIIGAICADNKQKFNQ
jgi:hypothetical protein